MSPADRHQDNINVCFGINRNSFYNNGISAALSDDAIFIGSGENNNITRSVIDSATTAQANISGVASGDLIGVYISDYAGAGSEYGEGRTFVGSATASGTTVTVPITGVNSTDWLTATRTSFSGARRRSSAFSANVQVP